MAESSVAFLLSKLASFLENDFQLFGDQLNEEIMSAQGVFERIKAHLRIADSLEDTDEEVRVWIKQIRDASHDMEDALDEFRLLSVKDQEDTWRTFLPKLPVYIKNLKARYRIISNVRSISSRIKSICGRHAMLKYKFKRAEQGSSFSCGDAVWQDNRGDALLLDEADLVGIEGPRQKLVQWMIEGFPRREVISVVGMGGLGKTTLVKQVYEDPAVKKHFSIRVWVSLSHTSKREELLKDMLLQIATNIRRPGTKRADTVNSDLLRTIIKDMLRNKRYLIVLDDIWHVSKWDTVKHAFCNDENGSRIMLTTRHADIASAACKDFNGGKKYELKPLPEEQSWELICRKTFKGKLCPPHLEDICKYILRKCEGLPLPIVAISGVLASRHVNRKDEWELVQRSLRSEIDGNDRLQNLKKVLSLSFSDLPYYLKSCFLHLSVFPEGQVIEWMRLVRLWVAEGFVEMKEGKTPEEVAEGYLNELLDRSLLQVAGRASDGRVKLCRIHHLLQNIGITKSKEQSFAVRVDEQSPAWPDRLRRMSIHNRYQPLHQNRSFAQLRSLLMFGVDKASMKPLLLNDMKLLNVLDLQSAPLKKFPIQVVDMSSLRYLSFRSTEVKSLPSSIGKLQNLETLDLKHTYVTELPIEIMKLQQLRHLLVYRYETVFYAHAKYGFRTAADIGCLQSLQKLSYIEAGDERSRFILQGLGRLIQLRKLCILNLKKEDGRVLCSSVANLSNLRAISISLLDGDEFLDLQGLSPPPLLQRIYLRGRLQALPQWIVNLSSLTTVHLRCCRLKDDPLIPLQNLPNLVHLELQDVYDWKTLRFVANGFRKLKRLGLDSFDELTSIDVEEGALPRLIELIIQRCKMFQNVPSGIEHMMKLRVLEFLDVHEELVKKLEQDEGSEVHQKVVHIPELRYGRCMDDGWDVKTLERSGKEGPRRHGTDMGSTELPRCWK